MFKVFLKRQIVNADTPVSHGSLVKKNRRQFDRFDVSSHSLIALSDQDIAQIIDISEKGFSCQVPERAFEKFLVGDIYEARIRYLGETFDVTIRVAWKRSPMVGFVHSDLTDTSQAFFDRILHPLALAKSLKLVDAEFTKLEEKHKTWYHGDESTDFTVWRDERQDPIAFQLIFNQHFVEWDEHSGFSTGITQKESQFDALLEIPNNETLVKHDHISQTCLQFAIDLLMALNNHDAKDILPILTEELWHFES